MYAQYFRTGPSPKEGKLNRTAWIRPFHRWTSIVFTLTVIANFIAMAFGTPPALVTYAPLPPLFLLLFSGLCMFVLHYAARGRSA